MAEQQLIGGEQEVSTPVGMDMDAALADIASAIGAKPDELQESNSSEETGDHEDKALETEATEVKKAEPEKAAANSADIAPDTWRKEAKEAWAGVPPVVKEEMRKRESDIASYVERVKQPIAVGEKLTEMIRPYLPMFQKTGVDPWHNIGAMLQAQERLLFGSPEEKLAMFGALAQQAGIKFEAGQLSAPPDAHAAHVRRLEERLAQLEGGVNQVTSTVQEARQKELMDNVATFAQDPAHPHFYAVTDKISHLIRTGAVGNLQEAYELATMADPVIRQKVLEEQAGRLATTKAADEAARLKKARAAGKVLVRSTQSGKAAQPPGSIDDTLEETLAAIRAR
jgi:hypothetical protein